MDAVAAIHVPLSHEGFHFILQTLREQFSEAELEVIIQWASNWTADAKQRAEQVSEFPDVMDFIRQAYAMKNIRPCLM